MLPSGIYYRSLATTCGGNTKCSMICLILAPLISFLVVLYFYAGVMWVVFFLLFSAIAFLVFYIHALMEQSRRMSLIQSTTNMDTDTGLDACQIATLPTFKYERESNDSNSDCDENNSNRWAQCAICLSILQVTETVKRIPVCRHFFHVECIDKWLRLHSTCPMCRSAVVSPPLRPPV